MTFLKSLAQIALGAFLLSAGISHLDSNRTEFLAQVPTWLPLDADFVVVASGLVEITLGALLITTVLIFKKYRRQVGLITAIFFILKVSGPIGAASYKLIASNRQSLFVRGLSRFIKRIT